MKKPSIFQILTILIGITATSFLGGIYYKIDMLKYHSFERTVNIKSGKIYYPNYKPDEIRYQIPDGYFFFTPKGNKVYIKNLP